MSNSLQPNELQHTRLYCSSQSPQACSNSYRLSRWCHPNISSSVIPFSSCLLFFPASGSFPMSKLDASGSRSIGASASVLPINIQCWFPLELTGWISLLSKGLSRVFSNGMFQKHQSFRAHTREASCATVHEVAKSQTQLSDLLYGQLSYPYMTTEKTLALTMQTFVGKVMSLFF